MTRIAVDTLEAILRIERKTERMFAQMLEGFSLLMSLFSLFFISFLSFGYLTLKSTFCWEVTYCATPCTKHTEICSMDKIINFVYHSLFIFTKKKKKKTKKTKRQKGSKEKVIYVHISHSFTVVWGHSLVFLGLAHNWRIKALCRISNTLKSFYVARMAAARFEPWK
jgi:hypothetical protein